MSEIVNSNKHLLDAIVSLIDSSRSRVASTVNSELTLLYWNIGKQINDNILKNKRADYGKQIISELSKELVLRYGRGFGKRNLHNFLRFNDLFPEYKIVQTLSAQLTWSHIYSLLSIKDNLKREFYIQMCKHEMWSVRTLQDRISSMLFERTALSKVLLQIIFNHSLQKNRLREN